MSATANPDTGEEELITVANFSHPTEADPVVAWLESEGIECFVTNEHTITMNWLYSNAIGGVGVQVKAADVERANEILQAVLNPDAAAVEPTPSDAEMDQASDATSEIRLPAMWFRKCVLREILTPSGVCFLGNFNCAPSIL